MYFGLAGAVYLFPFVLFGLWCGRFSSAKEHDQSLHLQLGVVFTLTAFLHAVMVTQALPDQRSASALVLGCGACLMLLKSGMESNVLAMVGRHSFAIFLFHAMASAASRIVLTKVGLASLYLMVPMGMLAGIALPVLVALWLKNVPLWAQWVMGEAAPKRALDTPFGAHALGWIPGYSAHQKRIQARIQRRLQRVRADMALVELVQSVQSKQGKDTAF